MTGLRDLVKTARRLAPVVGAAAFGLAILTLIPGCPPTALTVRVACPADSEVATNTDVDITATANKSGSTIAITADGGATVVDNGDGTATVSSATPGDVTVTATATNGTSTATDTCTIHFVGATITPPAGGTDVTPGEAVTLTADTSSLATGGGEGDEFTFEWSVDPADAGTFDCGANDQNPDDELTTDCQSIGFTVGADFQGSFTVSVTVTRNSDGANFTSTLDFTSAQGCTTDADCDDGAFCNGAETCVDGACVAGTSPCAEGETCDETNDVCTGGTCTTDADCDDGLFCNGAEACVAGACVAGSNPCADGESCDEATDTCFTPCSTDADCDDGLFCNGSETCVSGACAAGTSPCAEGETCDEDADSCGPECTTDADCDDGLFCNGTETCVDGACTAGTSPCNEDETCDEDTDACIPPTGTTFTLTFNPDAFTGGSGDDTFSGLRTVVGSSFVQTLGNSDNLDGGDGTDTANIQFVDGGTTTPTGLSNIEVYNLEITDTNASTLNMLAATGVTTINNNASGAALTITNLGTSLGTLGLTNLSTNTTITNTVAALTGGSNELAINLSGVTGGTVTAQPSSAGNGYETFSLNSTGGVANTVAQLTDGNGNSLTTVNISGDQGLTVSAAFDSTVTTINAADMSGALSTILPAANVTYTGGSGADTVNDAGNYSTSDALDGGDGTDVLVLNSSEAAASGNQSNVTNFETLKVADALGSDLTISRFGCTKLILNAGLGAAYTATVPVGGTLEISGAATGFALTCSTPAGSDTTSDTLNVNVKGVNVTGNLILSSWETVNLAVSTAAVQFTGNLTLNNIAGNQKLVVTGAVGLTLGDAAGDAITADEIDASAFTGSLTITGTPQVAITIKGGTGNDTLLGSTSGDDLRGGDGNDSITGGDGADAISCGNGNDTVHFGSRTNTGDIITDFDFGTSSTAVDKISFTLDNSTETGAWDDDTLTNAIAQCQGATTDPIAAVVGTPTVQTITADSTTANSGTSIFIFNDGVEYTAATLQTALQTAGSRTITTGSDGTVVAVNFIAIYDKGSSIGIAVIRNAANATTTEGCTVTEIASISGVSSLANVDATDFLYE